MKEKKKKKKFTCWTWESCEWLAIDLRIFTNGVICLAVLNADSYVNEVSFGWLKSVKNSWSFEPQIVMAFIKYSTSFCWKGRGGKFPCAAAAWTPINSFLFFVIESIALVISCSIGMTNKKT